MIRGVSSGLDRLTLGYRDGDEDLETGGSHRLRESVRIIQRTHGHTWFVLRQSESRPHFHSLLIPQLQAQ